MGDSAINTRSSESGFFTSIKNFGSEVYEGAVMGDYSGSSSTTKSVSQIGVGLIPIAGQIADTRDTSAALGKVWRNEEGGWKDLAIAVVGWLPGLGDWIKSGGKVLARSVGGEAAEVLARGVSETKITKSWELDAGEGFTDKYGNITISAQGSEIEQRLVLEHELVHSFLSPKAEFLKELRADIRMTAYQSSSLLRYLEEALAESYAQVKVNGISGIPEGLAFPIKNGYVTLSSVISEGAIGSIVVGGATYGVYVASQSNE